MEHDWAPSSLGHGEAMCRRCFGTNRELAALGELAECHAPVPTPTPANTDDDEDHLADCADDDEADEDFDDDSECMLRPDGQCGAAGSEWCDFECPNRNSELFAGSAAYNRKHGIR